MTSEALLSELLDAGLQLWAEDDQLCFRGPKSVLTPDRRSSLKEAKPELIGLLGQHRKHASVSAGQRRLYFLDRFSPDSPLYHIPCFWSLNGPADPPLIEKAIQTIVDRHESLRTSFCELGGNVYQVIQLEQKILLEIIPSESATAFTRRWMKAPLDLTSGPVFRVALLPVSETESLLALLVHHSVFDGRSTEIFLDEFGQALDALSKRTTVTLPELNSSCSDLAARRPDKDATAEAQRDLDYWLDRLAGELSETPLPTDFPRPPVRSHHGERFSIPLPGHLAERLFRLGEAEGATFFMSGLAAFATLLERYGADGESVIGTPVSGRPSTESNALIGFFVNTLILRLDSSGDPTFKSMLERVRQSTLKDFAHQQTPFERLVEELKPTRDPGRSPLFQVMFSVQARIPDLEAGGLTVGMLPIRPETAKFDLWLSLTETREGWQITLEFSKDLFSRDTAERIAGHYLRILTAVVEAPEKKLSELDILDDDERSSLIGWSRAVGDYPRDLSIPDIFEQQVARTPHATAILHGDRQLDYQTLNDHADRLARRIIDTGLQRSGIIAILTNRSFESITAMLAVLKAGAAYLPLDPDHPPERLAATVHDSGARLLLYHETKVNISEVSCLDIGKGSEPSSVLPPRKSKGDDPAYVIHTSGSTGIPKGVRIPHRGVLRLVLNTNYIRIQEDDRIAHASNPAFDASTFEIWGALLNGACLTIVDREELLSPQLLRRRLLTDRISVMFLTTSLFNLAAELAPESFDSLRILLFGGEAADPDKVRRVCERDHDVKILNVYGPTESTSFATFHRIDADKVSNPLPIGRAISNTSLHVLDPHGKRVPPGIAGELFIGGDGLAIDYWQRPELTAERFPTLHLESENQRLYRSGDRVRWNRGGELEFLGRLDRQIKMRGFRIEPGEIEATLTSHPNVSAAVVIVINDGAAGPRLVAYVVTVSEIEKLSTFLTDRLPGYMVPATIIPLAELPLTPNGKLDRERLPSPQRRPVSPDTERLSDQQQKLAEIWRDLLGLDQVGLDDDFFSLGGHSLLSLRLIHRIEAEFDKGIPLTALFKHPTIRGLSERLNESSSDLLALQNAGKLTPVFFLYADYLNGREFSQALAERLGSDRPLCVLPPLSNRVQRLSSGIEEEASNQITKLKEAAPQGPWILAGYCAGAWVAYEMARQLEQAGERVESLILIELPTPDQPTLNLVSDGIVKAGGVFGLDPGRQLALFSLLWSLRWKARGFSKLLRSPDDWPSIPKRCWRWIEESLLYAGRAKSGWNDEKEPADPIRDGSLEHLWQRARYRAGNYSGPVHLLLAESATPEAAKRALASWQRLAPATSVTLIPGDHESCVQEHRSEFVDRFSKLLDS